MTNKKTMKRSLLLSALSLVLCISMLVGTTFAWFTDSVSSKNNIIKSGNLDVELYYSVDGENWAPVDEDTNVFSNQLWEPGHTEVVYLMVKNEGSLAMKYDLGINIASEVAGVNVAGQEFLLSDYIMYNVLEYSGAYANRDAAREAAENGATKLNVTNNKNGYLASGAERVVAMVVYMPETVGNEANYRGTQVPTINLGINLFATQHMSENDSYGPDYDGGAYWVNYADTAWYNENVNEYVIYSAEQLAGLAQLVNNGNSFADKTVKLGGNIDLAGHEWTSIGDWDNVFEGDFYGQDYTISNLYINAPEGEGVGLFGVVANANIKNVTIENVDITGYSMVAGLVGAAYPAKIDNCHITGEIEIVSEWAYVAGIAGYCYYGTQVSGCSVEGDDMGLIQSNTRNGVGGITAWLLEGAHKVTNCSVKNLNLVGWTNVGGITGFVHYNNTISGCSVENVNLTKTRGDGNPGIGLIAGGYSYHATNVITLENNSVKNATLNGTHVAFSAYNVLYGSEYDGVTNANFVLNANAQDGITNKLVVVKAIKTAAELKAALAEDEDVILLVKDISVTGESNTPDRNNYVEVYGNKTGVVQYGGVLDGNGNMLIDSEGDKSYLLVTHGGTIKNLIIKSGARGIVTYSPTEDVIIDNVIVDGAGYALNSTEQTAVNMKISNSTINGWTSLAGFESVQLTNCKLGENSAKYWQNMGYDQDYDRLFRVYSPTYFTNCEFEQGYYLDLSAGGFATLKDCVVNGVEITAENYAEYITIELPSGKVLADCVAFE